MAERVLTGHTGPIRALAFDRTNLISGSDDATLRLWDLNKGTTVHTFKGHTAGVRCVAVVHGNFGYVSGSRDGNLYLWDYPTVSPMFPLKPHGDVYSVAVTPGGRFVLSGSDAGALELWDLDFSVLKRTRTYKGHKDSVRTIAITPDGRHALSGDWDGNTILWDLSRDRPIWDLNKDRPIRTFASELSIIDGVQSVAVMPDGVRGITGAYDGTIYVWDLNTGQLIQKLDQCASKGNWVTALIAMPDNKHILSAHHEYQACLWNINNKRIVHSFGVIADALALSPDGQIIAASDRNIIRILAVPHL